jgi:hypothetical protein
VPPSRDASFACSLRGGHLLVMFRVGDEHKHVDEVDGLTILLDFYRQRPDEVATLPAKAGFDVRVRVTGARRH